MSKTVRRKGVKKPECFGEYRFLKLLFGSNWWRHSITDLPLMWQLYCVYVSNKLWHSDHSKAATYRGNTPAHFRRSRNRIFRTKCSRVTKNIRRGNYWEYSYPMFKKDAGWEYW